MLGMRRGRSRSPLDRAWAEVESISGKPDKIIDLGAKKIYVYKDLKITFTDGRVSDVQ